MDLHMVFYGLYYQNCLKTGPIPDQGLCPVRVRPGPVRVRKISVRSGPVPLELYLEQMLITKIYLICVHTLCNDVVSPHC